MFRRRQVQEPELTHVYSIETSNPYTAARWSLVRRLINGENIPNNDPAVVLLENYDPNQIFIPGNQRFTEEIRIDPDRPASDYRWLQYLDIEYNPYAGNSIDGIYMDPDYERIHDSLDSALELLERYDPIKEAEMEYRRMEREYEMAQAALHYLVPGDPGFDECESIVWDFIMFNPAELFFDKVMEYYDRLDHITTMYWDAFTPGPERYAA